MISPYKDEQACDGLSNYNCEVFEHKFMAKERKMQLTSVQASSGFFVLNWHICLDLSYTDTYIRSIKLYKTVAFFNNPWATGKHYALSVLR